MALAQAALTIWLKPQLRAMLMMNLGIPSP